MTVHLVGAGPGDPALLTLAAAELLRDARGVLYDRPSLDAIVALAPPEAEKHCVGRAPGRKALPQAEVNALLIELGRTRDVVRLKSGDPFVASRGGEEAVALGAAGINVRVIPGVSAALAAPATSCGSRAAIRSSPRGAARRQSRSSRPASPSPSSPASRPRSRHRPRRASR